MTKKTTAARNGRKRKVVRHRASHTTRVTRKKATRPNAKVAAQPQARKPATPVANGAPTTVTIRAYSNGTNIYIAWKMSTKIPNCIGFALRRKTAQQQDTDAIVLSNHIGFATAPDPIAAAPMPSTESPFQRCTWNDWLAPVQVPVQYAVAAVYGGDGTGPAISSGWSSAVTIGIDSQTGPLQCYFNDGVIATQWIAREISQTGTTSTSLMQEVTTPGSAFRARLGGMALPKLRELLTKTLQSGGHVFAALYELNDPELIDYLKQLKQRAHLVLSNGAGEKHGSKLTNVDENHGSRSALRAAGVDVKDRILPASGNSLPHFGHNKYAVFTDAQQRPLCVWTGSVNWTTTGLCTQMNNALLVTDPVVAKAYLDQWKRLAAAGNKWPPYKPATSIPDPDEVDNAEVTVTFTPFVGTKGTITSTEPADLAYCTKLIEAAQEGALFFFFNPGPKGTLLDAVAELQSKPNFYIRGVVNQDPNPKEPGIPDPANPHVRLLHRNQNVELPDEVAMPTAITLAHSYWLKEQLRLGNVLVHSKVVVLDPFGDHPVVMTGSHNMGTKASLENDENLIVVEGDAELAQAYAVNVVTVFNQYWWRYNRFAAANKKAGAPAQAPKLWPALTHDDSWQTPFLPNGQQRYEVDFWVHP